MYVRHAGLAASAVIRSIWGASGWSWLNGLRVTAPSVSATCASGTSYFTPGRSAFSAGVASRENRPSASARPGARSRPARSECSAGSSVPSAVRSCENALECFEACPAAAEWWSERRVVAGQRAQHGVGVVDEPRQLGVLSASS